MRKQKQARKVHNENLTELVFILDRSGSMQGLESDTIGGFNSMLEKQKKQKGDALVSIVLFDNYSDVIADRASIRNVRPLTSSDYQVQGCTALLDAIGGAIHHIGNVHKYAWPEDCPAHTLFIITTDGMENASRRYTYEHVRRMVTRQKNAYDWEFLFLGANMDAIAAAADIGIDEDRAVRYKCDGEGTQLNYQVVNEAIASVRCDISIAPCWKSSIENDYEQRKNSDE